jgi:MOSC domain-containing protein YiiM
MNTLRLYIGEIRRLDDEGQSTAIFKYPVSGSILLGTEGLSGDAQADKRVHGGPEKAVHHYAAENYAKLAARFPAVVDQFRVGSIGENLSTTGWDEHNVFIGDTFRLGTALVQVSQPRSPCWKIDHRYATKGIAGFIAESGLTGWYYRVLETGSVANDAPFTLEHRLPGAVSLATLWQVWSEHRPDPDTLARISEAPGLNPGWQKKLCDRMAWLRDHSGAPPTPTFHVKPTPPKGA